MILQGQLLKQWLTKTHKLELKHGHTLFARFKLFLRYSYGIGITEIRQVEALVAEYTGIGKRIGEKPKGMHGERLMD